MNYNADINKKTVFGSLVWKALERVASQGINLVIQIILARILLPEDFGSLAIIVAITNYAAIFVQSGLATAIVQKEALDDLDVSTLLTASLLIALMFYLILFGLAPVIANYYKAPELVWALRVLSMVLFLNAINSVQTAILSRRMQFKRLFLRSMIAVPVSGAVGIIMAYLGFGIWALVAQNISNTLTVVIVMSVSCDMHLSLKFSWKRAKEIYSFSGKILLTSLVSGLHDTVRTMTIGKKYSSQDLAYYDKAYTYSYFVTQIVNGTITSVLLPVFSRKQTEIDKLKNMARKSASLSAFIMFPVLLGFAAAAKPIVIILLTNKWEVSIPFLMIFCVLRLPGCITSIDKQVYYAIGRSGINLAYEIVLLIVNLSVLMISVQFGVMAIAVCATIVEIIGSFAIYCVSAKVYGYSLKERIIDIGRPLLNAGIMAAIVWCINLPNIGILITLLIQINVGIIVYILLAILTRDNNLYYLKSTLIGFHKNKISSNNM